MCRFANEIISSSLIVIAESTIEKFALRGSKLATTGDDKNY